MDNKKINYWLSIFMKNSGGISSKRVLSIIGILSCVGVFIASFVLQKPVPEYGNILLISCISLYGVEKIPDIGSILSKNS